MSSVNVSTENILPMYTVDAFTKTAFSGNPAAVCPLDFFQEVPDDAKQKIAVEMNLSETAFISILDERDTFKTGKRFGLRWFTPACEVLLCGHATLAAANVLFFKYNNQSSILEFETKSGILKAKKLSDGRIEMDLPLFEPQTTDMQKYEKVIEATIGSLPFKEVIMFPLGNLMIRLGDDVTLQEFRGIKPNNNVLLAAAPELFGVITTLKGIDKDNFVDKDGRKYDFFVRYFAPFAGVSEDPVTGSALSTVTPFWAKVLNKKEMYAHQCSKRGGDIYCNLLERSVKISGYSAVVLEGEIKF